MTTGELWRELGHWGRGRPAVGRDRDGAEALVLCCGGGGLTAGCVLAWKAMRPGAKIWAVEPEAFDDTARSLAAGKRVGNAPGATSLGDAILTPALGVLTFTIDAP